MREDLYRGKRKDNGEWIYGSLLHQTDYYGDKCDKYFIIDGTSTQDYDIGFKYEVISETVGQYIYVEDENKQKYFEHDIFIIGDNDYGYDEMYDKEHDGYLRIAIPTIDKIINEDFEYEFCALQNAKIIGNTYDNPELIR